MSDERLWDHVVWQCSYCGGICVTGRLDSGRLAVRHEAPVCEPFALMDIVDFVEANYAAQITNDGN